MQYIYPQWSKGKFINLCYQKCFEHLFYTPTLPQSHEHFLDETRS